MYRDCVWYIECMMHYHIYILPVLLAYCPSDHLGLPFPLCYCTAHISRGVPAKMDRYPYMVSLRNPDNGNAHMCGGALIRPTVVLTAAHCLEGRSSSPLVHVWIDQDQGFETLSVARAVRHDAWNLDWKEGSDIALLFLSRPTNNNPSLLKLMPQPEEPLELHAPGNPGAGEIQIQISSRRL